MKGRNHFIKLLQLFSVKCTAWSGILALFSLRLLNLMINSNLVFGNAHTKDVPSVVLNLIQQECPETPRQTFQVQYVQQRQSLSALPYAYFLLASPLRRLRVLKVGDVGQEFFREHHPGLD
ncbi:uncharacterized protein LOC118349557 [Juglans regia]|uniref:Uncharacterized protein LOC118349557 n=1 Tax=Juglans regia TaxID=51240 RepID=A0A6P9ERX3_JUGRE|nr:uncharacterized protein LOC118349557 [Juglans regia]